MEKTINFFNFDSFKENYSKKTIKFFNFDFFEENYSKKTIKFFNYEFYFPDSLSSCKETEFSENCSISETEEGEKNQINIELSVLADFSEVDEKVLNVIKIS